MAFFVRAVLWVVMLVAPGGVLLLPWLVRDAARRRTNVEGESKPALAKVSASPATQTPLPSSCS